MAEGFGAPPLLLLDEVTAHLDDGRREALFAAVLAIGAQAWMTGTEAELFAALSDRAQRLRVRTEGASRGWSGRAVKVGERRGQWADAARQSDRAGPSGWLQG